MHERKYQPRKYEDTAKWKSRIDNEVFDLVDMRKLKPKSYVTRQWVLTVKTDKQGFVRATGIERIPGQTKGLPANKFLASSRRGFRMSCQMAKLGSFPH